MIQDTFLFGHLPKTQRYVRQKMDHDKRLTVCVCVTAWGLTLEGAGRLLSQSEVLLCQMVHWLVLVDLYTGADITITV